MSKTSFYTKWSKDEENEFLRNLSLHFEIDRVNHFRESITPFRNVDLVNDIRGILDFEHKYSDGDFKTHIFNRQITALFSKKSDLDVGIDKEFVSYETFMRNEADCALINDRFLSYSDSEPLSSDYDLLIEARKKISSILGEAPSYSELRCGFGPGSNTTIDSSKNNVTDKFCHTLVCGRSAVSELAPLTDAFPALLSFNKTVRTGNGKLSFVPKSYKTHRSIIVEPTLNTFVQKGIGKSIREKLKCIGVDLKNGQSYNRSYARLASDGSLPYSTMDMESASDRISLMLVYFLLPSDWFSLLYAWRTSHIDYKGTNETRLINYELQKFSSMGNGYTFELESLIFYALACTIVKKDRVLIFGDDLVIPSEFVPSVTSLFSFCGFRINDSKSFYSGPFRESCGGDFFLGINIRPYYVKDAWSDFTCVCFLNHLYRTGYMHYFTSVYSFLLSQVKPENKLFGPDGYGDGHIVCDQPPYLEFKRSRGYSGFVFKTFQKRPKKRGKRVDMDGARLSMLHSIDSYYNIRYLKKSKYLRLSSIFRFLPSLDKEPSDFYIVRGSEGEKITNIYSLSK